jgi:hypothetical protein
MTIRNNFLTVFLILLFQNPGLQQVFCQEQIQVPRIEKMPDLPAPYKMINWYEKAKAFDQVVYNFDLKGDYAPFIWLDNSNHNLSQQTYGLYTVIGDVRQGPGRNTEYHEALCSLGSLMGAGLVGIDKTKQNGFNFVKMAQNYFNTDNKWNIVMNNTNPYVALLGGGYGRDWWYDVFPNVIFYGVCSLFPDVSNARNIQHIIAEQFYKADSTLNGNYDFSYFDYSRMAGMKNNIPFQQDASAGHSYVLFCAYQEFKDPRYLKGSRSALQALLNQKESRYYEVLMPFGALVAARLNAEEGTNYDISQILNWTFDGCTSATGRTGWGVMADKWGVYDVYGIQGSITDGGGYGFLMNTFDLAWPLVPLVKYDSRYARAIAKWMLNAANAARLYYPDEIDDNHQWLPEKKQLTHGVIAYEGLRKTDFYQSERLKGVTPVAQGDGPQWYKNEPEVSMFSIYSSAQVGIFGSIIRTTNVDGILQLNCNATDFYAHNSFPTYLYYNPYNVVKQVRFGNASRDLVDLYDVLTHQMVAKNIRTENNFDIPADKARLIVVLPHDSTITRRSGKYYVGDVVIAYQ